MSSSWPAGPAPGGAIASAHRRPIGSLAASLALHTLLLAGLFGQLTAREPSMPAAEPAVVMLTLPPVARPKPPEPERVPEAVARVPARRAHPPPAPAPRLEAAPPVPASAHAPAVQTAPPAPTAEDWAFAGRYALENSKAYRYTWGQQVRSMMGTAVEGADQGMVRFRVEISPDGSLAALQTLWSTSEVAERLARQAISRMPRGPATPTGRPLVFERTIFFTPFATDGPPLYRDDCLPDPPAFRNPYAWDGKSDFRPAEPETPEKPDPQALADCLKQLPKDSIEAEAASDQRSKERWGWTDREPSR